MSYGVLINWGAGNVDLTNYSGEDWTLQKTFTKTETLYSTSDFSPVIDTAKFAIRLNTDISTALLALGADDLVTVSITDNGSAWFTGYVRPLTGVTVKAGGGDTIDISCVDAGWALKKRPATLAQKGTSDSMVVFNGASTPNSIIHWVLSEAGYSGTVYGDAITEPVDYMRLYFEDYWDAIKEVLFAHHHTFYFDAAGDFHIYDWGPDSISSLGTLNEDDITKTLKVNRKDDDTNEVHVAYSEFEFSASEVVAAKSYVKDLGYDGVSSYGPITLEVKDPEDRMEWYANSAYRYYILYELVGEGTDTRLHYLNTWHTAASPKTGLDVTASDTNGTWSWEIETTGAIQAYTTYRLTKTQITAEIARVVEAGTVTVGSGGNIKTFTPMYCYDVDVANELAEAILVCLQKGSWQFEFESDASYDIGSYYTISNTAAGASAVSRIVAKTSTLRSGVMFYKYYATATQSISAPSVEWGGWLNKTLGGVSTSRLSSAVEAIESITDGAAAISSLIAGSSLPSIDDEIPAVSGLAFLKERIGFYDATEDEWTAYIANDGSFKFSGNGSSVEFDGTDFTVNADVALNGTVETGDAIQSSDYNPGVAGWQIDGDGNAEFNNLTVRAEVFEANFTSYDAALAVGFDGGGTSETPDEGDRRTLIDRDEFACQEYIDGAWTSEGSIRVGGGNTDGRFMPFVRSWGAAAQGIDYDSYSYENLPYGFDVFKLDGTGKSLDGELTTDISSAIFSGAQSKFFGSALFSGTSSFSDEVYSPSANISLGSGDTYGAGGWFYLDDSDYSLTGILCTIEAPGGEYAYIQFRDDVPSVSGDIRVTMYDGTTTYAQDGAVSTKHGAWNYAAFWYNSGEDKLHIVANGRHSEFASPGLSAVTSAACTVSFRGTNFPSGAAYLNEWWFFHSTSADIPAVTADILIGHYGHNEAWGYDGLDRDKYTILGDLHVTGESPHPPGWMYGLTTEVDTDSDHDIMINTGTCRSYDNTINITLDTAITKQIDASWTEGDDAGGLFSGSVANSTTYHLFVIKRYDGYVDAGFDTDIDCANIPTGYTAYRRVRSVVTDASANIIQTNQDGDKFTLSRRAYDYVDSVDGPLASTVNNLITLSVPADIEPQAVVDVFLRDSGTVYLELFQDGLLAQSETHSTSYPGTMYVNGDGRNANVQVTLKANSSSQIRCNVSSTSLDGLSIATIAYIDSRGRFGGK